MCKDLYFAKQVQFFLSSLSQNLVSLEKSCKYLEVELHCKDRYWSSFWRLVTEISDLWGSEPEGKGSRKPGMEQAWNRVVERVVSCLSDCAAHTCCRQALLSMEWNLSPPPCAVLLARADSPVSEQGEQRSLSTEASSWASAENVKFHMNLLEACVVCNEPAGKWSIRPDRFWKHVST